MPADRCPVCDRPHAEEWPAPEGTCGVRAAEVAEQRAAMAAVGTSLGGRCVGETEEVRAAREAPIKALWIAHDEAARANVAAQADCAAHVVDWRARCRTAERERDEARLDRDRARAALDEIRTNQGNYIIARSVRGLDTVAGLQTDISRLRAALQRFGTHTDTCGAVRVIGRFGSRSGLRWQAGDEETCACGLGAAMKDGGGR